MSIKALFLGYGRMGAALGEAWIGAGLVSEIDAVDPFRAQDVQARIYRQAADLPATAYDLVVMAVKPAIARDALRALPQAQLANATLVSVMAGVGIETLKSAMPLQRPVVRSMPNTPVMVNQGCTGLYAAAGEVSPGLRDIIGRLFNTVGKAFWVESEEQLHAVTAISGSGPAYYHLFSEALCAAGIKQGLPPELARQLAAQTALGAATLQSQDGADFAALRQAVTSPNGTTDAAIRTFEQNGALRRLVEESAEKARQRSMELSRFE